MRRSHGVALLLVVACSRAPRQASIELPGETIEDQRYVAQQVITSTSNEEVREAVKEGLPGIDDERLKGLTVRVQLPPGPGNAIPGINGRIWCQWDGSRDVEESVAVLEICIDRMQRALDDVMGGPRTR